ncbi:MAG: hypothetical protein PHZ07_01330 [Patescibacteria group bacterium]|nr:hypothetical protein [Patescibacteria group bacterium]MDD4303921.1 hypothetical protein [Patescibacteria group bacterium]MDD4695091.1 hypothetical protein [Patescibacteria group bacterium]
MKRILKFIKKDIKNNLRFYIVVIFLIIGFLLLNSAIEDLQWSTNKTYRECRNAQSYCVEAQSSCSGCEDTMYYCDEAQSSCQNAESMCEKCEYYSW